MGLILNDLKNACELEHVCDYVNNRTTSSMNYISTENMLPNKGGISESTIIPPGTTTEYKIGDILISNIRPYFQKIWCADRCGGCSADVLCIRAKENTDSKYLYYLLSQQAFFDYVMSGAKGCKMPRGDKKQIMQWPVNIPAIDVQKKVVAILSSLDNKIRLNRRINDNLEEQAKALFKSWFVDNQDNDWKKIRLEEILEIGKTSIIPAQSPDTIFEHYSLPAFDNGTRPAYEKGCAIKSSKFYIQKNIFLFSKLNPRIKRIWFPNIQTEKAICSTEFIPYKPKDASLLGFCYSIVNSEAFYEYVLSLTNGSTGSHQRFHPTATLDYSLKIPDKDIIKKFESIVRPLYELIAKNRTENEKLASLRDTLLPKLMSGKLSVEEVSFD